MSSPQPLPSTPDPAVPAASAAFLPDAGHPQPVGPLAAYRERVRAGLLDEDPEQLKAAARLDELWQALIRQADPASSGSLIGRLLKRRSRPAAPRGVYLVGQVGRGKSMLMDLFFEQTPITAKQRIHFHRFMQDAHKRVHALKRAQPGLSDPIPPLADAIAADATLLCFDEFQVNDIADAMILGRLFDALFARGVVIVATSNTVPEELFQNRPGADAFKPFIARIRAELDTVLLDSPRDYRRGGVRGLPTWHAPADRRAEQALDAAFLRLTGGVAPHAEALEVMGRQVKVPMAGEGVARFDFEALCAQALGAGDYLALAQRFPALIIDGIPRLGPENFDLARRFIVLVDALYEAKVKLIASAADGPDRIYERGEGATAFERTASRLAEMQTEAYLALPHLD
jgi:cell division protein ZapE